MKKNSILIVEDEEALAETLKLNLELENYIVYNGHTGNESVQLFKSLNQQLDVILLDVMLPDINGFDLCQQFKKINADIPVIFLTAKNLTAEKIKGLKMGAEDYITKPFELEELLLRVKNVIKRNSKNNTRLFCFGKCEINFETYEIKDINGNTHLLSRREIGLLQLLTENENKVISRDTILSSLWDEHENASSRTIDNFILGFRKYFEVNPKEPKHFFSIRGVGYKFSL